jgi:ribosomal protein L11 methyltransferase
MSLAMAEARYPYVWISVTEDVSDEASAQLFDLGALGVEERDATTLIKGDPGKVTLVASFEDHETARASILELPEAWSPTLHEVVGDAWRDEWKKYFKPFVVCEGIVVRPPWEAYEPTASERVLELEPGRAFGTGLHETTSLVAGELARVRADLAGQPILDLGCGSGILALIALVLGASHARAIDVDPEAVAVTRENAVRNDMADRVNADTTLVQQIDSQYPVVLANIEAHVLVPLAESIMTTVAPGGLLVLSGILVPQKSQVLAAYAGFVLEGAPERGEWIALSLRAPRR